MLYLCSVYSYRPEGISDEEHMTLMHKRYAYARKRTHEFLIEGMCVFSPITHCHPMAQTHVMPRTWSFWGKLDRQFIEASDGLLVLKMPHWEESEGITAEIQWAKELGLPIDYLECPDYEE